jgi:PAS domain S-box-containing protein
MHSVEVEPHEPLTVTDETLRILVGSIRDYAIFMLDPQGRIASWNIGAEIINGYRAEEIIGKHFSTFYPPEEIAAGKCEYELAYAERNGAYEERGIRVRKTGQQYLAHVLITAVRGPDGKLVGFAKVTRDLTSEVAANEARRRDEERFRLLVESVKEYAIFMLDPNGRVATWNAGAERIKGYRAAEIIGKHFSTFIPEEDIKAGKPEHELEVAARNGRFEDEGWRIRKDGSRFWANVTITALRDANGSLIGFAKVTRDLTERREHEEKRLRLAHAQEALRLRDEFLSIASHELRTPLTVLRLQLEALAPRIAELDDNLAGKIDRARRAGQRIDELVESLLDVSRIASGKFELAFAEIDLAHVARDVIDRMRELADKAQCSFVTTIDSTLVGCWDLSRVDQVLTNLISNAIRYAAGQPIEVTVKREGDEAVMRVRDHGPGLPPGSEERIFERFERAASPRHYGGLGLGLYVVHQIARGHGGSVTASNADGGGACFEVRLPIRRST